MGSSPYAKIAWAIDFGDQDTEDAFDWDDADVDSYDLEHKVMPGLFGFTEEPPELPGGWQEWSGDQRREWRKTYRVPWEARFDAAVPLTFERYGYERGGTALVLKRSLTKVDWGTEVVDPATLAPPSPEELAAFKVITDHLGYSGEIKLLLMAMYG